MAAWNRWHLLVLVVLSAFVLHVCEPASVWSADKKTSKKVTKKKKADYPPIDMPQDTNEVVLTYDPGLGAGQPERKGEAPYLKIQADGSVSVTTVAEGHKSSGKLSEKELTELLNFVVHDHEFATLKAAAIDEEINQIAAKSSSFTDVKGIGTSTIMLKLPGMQNTVSYRAATIYYKKHPNAKEIGRFAEVEGRLMELGSRISKGKKK